MYVNVLNCLDVDECIEGLATCGAGNLCQNQAGSYMCVKQPDVKDKPCKKEGYIRDYDGNCVGRSTYFQLSLFNCTHSTKTPIPSQ